MKHSLQRHLTLMLGSAVLLSALLAATASFVLAYFEAKEFQDDMLKQVATFEASDSGRSFKANGPGAEASGDPESHITIFHLPTDIRPAWLTDTLAPGFHTLDTRTDALRAFVLDRRGSGRTVVVQPTDARNEIALNSALRTLVPLLLLLPLLAWLVVRIVRSELSPIAQLSRSLDEQPGDRPHAIIDAGLPDEITPFVHAINRLLERVNHLMGEQRRFIADAAHELRTPLTALSLQAQNLRHAASLEDMKARVLPLQNGIERARQMTEQLLNLARIQAEQGGKSNVEVSAMARELIADALPLAEARRIDLGLDAPLPLHLETSPEGLRLILGNGLENALKYTQAGGEITIGLRTEEEYAVIEIVDNGPGIPAEEQERVFDAFYRLPGSGKNGSGLGLAIAREAAARLGGTVSLHTPQSGHGLVFRYTQKNGRAEDEAHSPQT